MNRKLEKLAGTYAAALLLTSTALAEESTKNNSLADNGTNRSEVPTAKLMPTTKTSELMGKNVKNLQGEKIGDVTDIIVDLAASRVVAVIISSGGFLGVGDELSIVPPAALRFVDGSDHLQLDVSKETLSQAPRFKSNEWPDLTKAGYLVSVYSAYKVEAYSDKSTQQKADNAAVNRRDRDNNKPTAFDQGNSDDDVAITTQIRKDIMAQKDISLNGQNVKIITKNGHVTLRGPVNTAEEKRVICDLAIKATSKENVDDQLEVK